MPYPIIIIPRRKRRSRRPRFSLLQIFHALLWISAILLALAAVGFIFLTITLL